MALHVAETSDFSDNQNRLPDSSLPENTIRMEKSDEAQSETAGATELQNGHELLDVVNIHEKENAIKQNDSDSNKLAEEDVQNALTTSVENGRLSDLMPNEAETIQQPSKQALQLESSEVSLHVPESIVSSTPELKSKLSEPAEKISSAFLRLFEPASRLFEAKAPQSAEPIAQASAAKQTEKSEQAAAADEVQVPVETADSAKVSKSEKALETANATTNLSASQPSKSNEPASLFEKISKLTILTARLFESTKKPAESNDAKRADNSYIQSPSSPDSKKHGEAAYQPKDCNTQQKQPELADLTALRKTLLSQHVQKSEFSKLQALNTIVPPASVSFGSGGILQKAELGVLGKSDASANLFDGAKKATQRTAKPSDAMAVPKQEARVAVVMQKARAIGSIAEVSESSIEAETNSSRQTSNAAVEQNRKAHVGKFSRPAKPTKQAAARGKANAAHKKPTTLVTSDLNEKTTDGPKDGDIETMQSRESQVAETQNASHLFESEVENGLEETSQPILCTPETRQAEDSLLYTAPTDFDGQPNGERMREPASDDDIAALLARSRNLTKRTSQSDDRPQPPNEVAVANCTASLTGINFSPQIGSSKSTFSAPSSKDAYGTDTVDFAQISALLASAKSLTNRREPEPVRKDSTVPQYAERSPVSSTGDSVFDLPPLSPKDIAHEYSTTSDSFGEASNDNDATATVVSREEAEVERHTAMDTVDSDRIAALLASARSLVNRVEPPAAPRVSTFSRQYTDDRRSSINVEAEEMQAQSKDDDVIDASKISALIASAQSLVSRTEPVTTPPVENALKPTEANHGKSGDELDDDDLFADNDADQDQDQVQSADVPSEQRLQALLASARSYTTGTSVSSGRSASTYQPLSREVYGVGAERSRLYESAASRSSVSGSRIEPSYASPVAEAASMFRAISMRSLFDEQPRRSQPATATAAATRYYVPRNLESRRPVDIADRVPQLRGFRDQHRMLCRNGVRRHAADLEYDVEPPADYTMRASDEFKAETSFYQSVLSAQAILNTLSSDDRFSTDTSSMSDRRNSYRLSSAPSARLSASRYSFNEEPRLDEVDAYEQVSATTSQSETLDPLAAESAAATTTTSTDAQSTAKNDNFLQTLNEADAILSLLAKSD